jgi:transposase
MNLVELVKVTSSEEEPEKFLRAKGILKTFDRCPFCGHQKIGRIRRSFFKCYGCRKEWCIRKDNILEGLKVPFTKFIPAVKLFILEVPVNKACKELELAYNTTHKMDNRIWMKILIKKYLLRKDVSIETGYIKGYEYHQREAKGNPKLLEWIKRESYIYNGGIK